MAAQMAERGLEHDQHRNAMHSIVKVLEAAVIHDPVDHDPPEHDRRERQQAEQNRADGKIAGHPPVAQQLADDQPHAERAVLVAQPVVALDQNDLAVPGGGEAHLVEDQRRILVRARVLQDDVRRLAPSG